MFVLNLESELGLEIGLEGFSYFRSCLMSLGDVWVVFEIRIVITVLFGFEGSSYSKSPKFDIGVSSETLVDVQVESTLSAKVDHWLYRLLRLFRVRAGVMVNDGIRVPIRGFSCAGWPIIDAGVPFETQMDLQVLPSLKRPLQTHMVPG